MKDRNRRKLIFGLALLVSAGGVHAQRTDANSVKTIDTSAIHISRNILGKIKTEDAAFKFNNRVFSNETYGQFFDSYFTRLAFDKDGIVKGNSVSIKTSTDQTQLNLNLSYKTSHWIFTGGANLAASNNIGDIISGTNVAAGTSYYMKAAYLFKKSTVLFYSDRNRRMIQSIQNTYLDSMGLEYGKYYTLKANAMMKDLLDIDGLLKDKTGKVTDTQRIALIEKRRTTTETLNKLGLLGKEQETTAKVSALIDTALYKIQTGSNGWSRFSFLWLSGGLNYSQVNYSTFDSSLPFAKQFGSQAFDSVGASISLSWFDQIAPWYAKNMLRTFDEYYVSGTFSLYKANTFSGITNSTILRNSVVSNGTANNTVQDTKKAKIITGKKYSEYWMQDFTAMASFILTKPGNMGVNLNFDDLVSNQTNPNFTARIGWLFYLTNSDDPKSKLSFELFLQLPDLADAGKTGKSTWQRKVVGINTAIPFSKVFFKSN